MTQINAYLTFNGNCREAMMFYHRCLGGEVAFQTVGESPISGQMPAKMQECILHATLTRDNLVLMGSDMVGRKGLIRGNAVSLLLNCTSENEIHDLYANLSENGETLHPIEHSFWGALFGDLIDRYGNQWLLHYQAEESRD